MASQMGRPKFVNVVGQSEEKRLFAHLGPPSSKFPVYLTSLRWDNAKGTELFANVLMVALTIELRIGQHHPNALRAFCHLIEQRGQGGAVISRSGVCFLH